MRKIFHLFLVLFFVYLLLRLVDVNQVVGLITSAKWQLVLLAILVGILQSFFGAARLKTLFSIVDEVSISYIWPLSYVGALISLILPFSIGGFSMAYFLTKKVKVSYVKSFAILFVDFAMGVIIILILAFIGLVYFSEKRLLSVETIGFNGTLGLLLAGFIALIIIVFLLAIKWPLSNLSGRLKQTFFIFSKSKAVLAKAALVALVVAMIGFGRIYLYFMAFGMKPPAFEFILAISLFGLLVLIPGVLAKIGQYETFGILTLPYLLDLDKNSIFATLLVAHTISIFVILVAGMLSASYLKIDLQLLRTAKKSILASRRDRAS
ncbi:MAG: YbhN family protein [Patescibacteria group bacterium]